jgi:hypothetical protein
MIVTGSGSSWTAIKAPVPPDAAELADPTNGIACSLLSVCVATGAYIDKSDRHHGLLLIGSGKSWAAVRTPLPADAATYSGALGQFVSLGNIACPSASACVAVGTYTDIEGQTEGLLVTGSGKTWASVRTAVPPGADAAGGTGLSSVTCPTPARCVATGDYTDSYGHSHEMLVTGSGTAWKAVEARLPQGADASSPSSLGDIVCSSVTNCAAVGHYTDARGFDHWMLVTGSGMSWTSREVPMPPGANALNAAHFNFQASLLGGFDSVACFTPSKCVATGRYGDPSTNDHPLLMTPSPS